MDDPAVIKTLMLLNIPDTEENRKEIRDVGASIQSVSPYAVAARMRVIMGVD